MELNLQMPQELRTHVEALVPLLEQRAVSRLDVFSYRRPGEQQYWQAFIFVGRERHVMGTPDLRHLPMEEQLDDLVRQLSAFQGRTERSSL